MDTLLHHGQIIPTFTLPDSAGRPVRRPVYRGLKHLVLVFLPSTEDKSGLTYLRALADRYELMRGASATVLAVVRGEGDAAQAVKTELDLPFPLLIDAGGSVATRFM